MSSFLPNCHLFVQNVVFFNKMLPIFNKRTSKNSVEKLGEGQGPSWSSLLIHSLLNIILNSKCRNWGISLQTKLLEIWNKFADFSNLGMGTNGFTGWLFSCRLKLLYSAIDRLNINCVDCVHLYNRAISNAIIKRWGSAL